MVSLFRLGVSWKIRAKVLCAQPAKSTSWQWEWAQCGFRVSEHLGTTSRGWVTSNHKPPGLYPRCGVQASPKLTFTFFFFSQVPHNLALNIDLGWGPIPTYFFKPGYTTSFGECSNRFWFLRSNCWKSCPRGSSQQACLEHRERTFGEVQLVQGAFPNCT